MKALALDFDGVISDSAPEAFVVAVRTFRELEPEAGLGGEEAERDPGLFAGFLALMPLGNRAEDYGVCLAALAAGERLPDQAAYDAFRDRIEPARLAAFHRRFYQVRRAWAERDPGGWRACMRPYPGVCGLLHRRAGDVRLAIATAKDRVSVRELLRAYGISELFPDAFLLDKEAGVSKRAHVEEVARRVGCSVREVAFVDDKVNHLMDVAPLGARCLLAAWGYNGEREHILARRAGFPVCDVDELEATLFGAG